MTRVRPRTRRELFARHPRATMSVGPRVRRAAHVAAAGRAKALEMTHHLKPCLRRSGRGLGVAVPPSPGQAVSLTAPGSEVNGEQ